MLIVWLFAICTVIANSYAANILIIVPTPAVSHQRWFYPIVKELTHAHNVTFITPYPIKDGTYGNLVQVDVKNQTDSVIREMTKFFSLKEFHNIVEHGQRDHDLGVLHTSCLKISEEILDVIKSDLPKSKYDLLILEWLYYPLLTGISWQYNIPLIGIASQEMTLNGYFSAGNPLSSTYKSDHNLPYHYPLSFFERLDVLYHNFRTLWRYNYILIPQANDLARKYFAPPIPSLDTIEKNVSLLITNTSPLLSGPYPLNPNIIEVGGINSLEIQANSKRKLPEDLQTFLDASSSGVVYISFGTSVPDTPLKTRLIYALIDVFLNESLSVIVKHSKNIPEYSSDKRVFVRSWFSQATLLLHKNVKMFVLQGGRNSIEEAIWANVPMLVIPFIADQHYNARRVAYLNLGKHYFLPEINSSKLRAVVVEIMSDQTIKDNLKKISRLLIDQPMDPAKKATWWINYVIRNNGAKYLRNPGTQMDVMAYFMIDCFMFVLLVVFAVVLIIAGVFSTFCRKSNDTKKRKND